MTGKMCGKAGNVDSRENNGVISKKGDSICRGLKPVDNQAPHSHSPTPFYSGCQGREKKV